MSYLLVDGRILCSHPAPTINAAPSSSSANNNNNNNNNNTNYNDDDEYSSINNSITQLITPLPSTMFSSSFSSVSEINEEITTDFDAITSSRNGTITLWRKETPLPQSEIQKEQNVGLVENGDSKSSTEKPEPSCSSPTDHSVYPICTFQAHNRSSSISDIRVNPSRNLLLSASWDRTLKLWSVSHKNERKKTLAEENDDNDNINLGATKTKQGGTKVSVGTCLSTAIGHGKDVTCCFLFERAAFAYDSSPTSILSDDNELRFRERLIFGLSASRDGTVRLWYFGHIRILIAEDETASLTNGSASSTNVPPYKITGYDVSRIHSSAICIKIVKCFPSDWLTSVHPIWSPRQQRTIIFVSGGFDGVICKWKIELEEILRLLCPASENDDHDTEDESENLEQQNKQLTLSEEVEILHRLHQNSTDQNDECNDGASSTTNKYLLERYVVETESKSSSAINSLLLSPDSSLVSFCTKDGSIQTLLLDISDAEIPFKSVFDSLRTMPNLNANSHKYAALKRACPVNGESSSSSSSYEHSEFFEPVLQLDHPSQFYWIAALSPSKIAIYDLEWRQLVRTIGVRDEDGTEQSKKMMMMKSQNDGKHCRGYTSPPNFTAFNFSHDSLFIMCGLSDGSVRVYDAGPVKA